MRHKKRERKLGRTWEHRKAMLKNLAKALVEQERIQTTEAKAKELRRVADKLVGYGLQDTVHARRNAFKLLENKTLVKKLFDEIAPRFQEVPGGYTRVVKSPYARKGDGTTMAIIEFSRQASEQE